MPRRRSLSATVRMALASGVTATGWFLLGASSAQAAEEPAPVITSPSVATISTGLAPLTGTVGDVGGASSVLSGFDSPGGIPAVTGTLALTTGIFILGSGETSAAETTGADSVAGGTQNTPVTTTSIAVGDNAVTVIGDPATGGQDTGPPPATLLGYLMAPVPVPVLIAGTAAAVVVRRCAG